MSTSPIATFSCPSCESKCVTVFYETLSAPVNSVLLLSTRDEAMTFPTDDIRLGLCHRCGFIYSTSFNPTRVEYSSRCEESQGFSPFFKAWHENLARRLINRYSLHGKKIVEIGCGKGEFLALLCDLGDNRGTGFDPAYVPDRIAPGSADRIQFIRDFYSEMHSGLRGDFLCCKMTLEHISDTGQFIRMVRSSLRKAPHACVFFQVPNVLRILKEEAFWDIYYEHCSYFSSGSLARLFRRSGFDVLDVGYEYSDQYVTIEARVGDQTERRFAAEEDLQNLEELVETFATRVPTRIAQWRIRLEEYLKKGLKTVAWGAGSKGVTFASVLDVPGSIEYVVDVNPNMSGHYLAKTGLKIVAPSVLYDYRPDVVIVMNPVYREEIAEQLKTLGLAPQVISI